MKKSVRDFIIKYKRIILIVFILLLIVLFSVIIIKKVFVKKHVNYSEFQEYSDDVKELTGTKKYSNNQLVKEHCLGDICILDVTIRYVNKIQIVEYVVKNNSKKTKTGHLFMVFGDNNYLLSYDSLKPGKTVKNSFQMFGSEFKTADDYTLRELTKEEIESIK